MRAPDADRVARGLIRALEPELRRHLGLTRLDRDLIGELYLSLRQSLSRWERTADRASDQLRLLDELALNTYLIASARPGAGQPGPSLLESLRDVITRAANAGAFETPLWDSEHGEGRGKS